MTLVLVVVGCGAQRRVFRRGVAGLGASRNRLALVLVVVGCGAQRRVLRRVFAGLGASKNRLALVLLAKGATLVAMGGELSTASLGRGSFGQRCTSVRFCGLDSTVVRGIVVAGVGLAMLGCSTPPRGDLANNEFLYTDLQYSSRLPGDQIAFVAPMQDERTLESLPRPTGPTTIHVTPDTIWDRPMRDMVDEVFRRELKSSGVFAQVVDKPKAAGLVVQPSMVTLFGAHEESMDGARGLAEVGLRVRVYGQATENGKRDLLWDETFEGAQATGVAHRLPPTPVLIGGALKQAMYGALDGLDTSNVARDGVPIEASARRASRPLRR